MNPWTPFLLFTVYLYQLTSSVPVYNISSAEKKLMCPIDWDYKPKMGRCLYADQKAKKYHQRIEKCSNHRFSELARSLSKEENEIICSQIKILRLPVVTGDYVAFWLGATDSILEGTYRWNLDRKKLLDNETSWDERQPNDIPGDDKVFNCLALLYTGITSSCLWNDWICTAKNFAMCEIRDPNSCVINNGGCQHVCLVTGTRKKLCACKAGYNKVKNAFCVDVDECITDNGGCEHHCSNYPGGYKCSCRNGYQKLGYNGCEDVNECKDGIIKCAQLCNNTDGSFTCSCLTGYEYVNDFKCKLNSVHEEKSKFGIFMAVCSVILSIVGFLISCCFFMCRAIPVARQEELSKTNTTLTTGTGFQNDLDSYALQLRNHSDMGFGNFPPNQQTFSPNLIHGEYDIDTGYIYPYGAYTSENGTRRMIQNNGQWHDYYYPYEYNQYYQQEEDVKSNNDSVMSETKDPSKGYWYQRWL